MKLFTGRITPIATEIVRTLTTAGDIEASSQAEAVKDIEAVLKNYLEMEKDVNDQTKELLARTGRTMDDFNRVRVSVAESKGIQVGDEMLDYVLDQIVEMFGQSQNVDEIFVEDVVLRRKMAIIFKKHLNEDAQLDVAVRAQLKNLKEGTQTWEIEYARVLEQMKRKQGLQ